MSNFAQRPHHTPLNLAYQIKWEQDYQKLLRKFLTKHHQFDGSQLCAWMRAQGLHDPDHHNHWATQITYYSKLGWFVKHSRGIPSGRQSHMNVVTIWESPYCKPPKRKVK